MLYLSRNKIHYMNIKTLIEKIVGLNKPKSDEPSFLEQKPNIKTTYPNAQVNFNEWAQNLHVSQLYQR
jgi:hypothetical protein